MLNYEEALAFIHGRAGYGKKLGLENMRRLLRRLGNPQEAFCSLHVAGTNGKGSVCAFAASALRAAGRRVGLYTSPYLMRYNERMQIDGRPIPDERLAQLTAEVAEQIAQMEAAGEGVPTIFETGTAIAFLYFAREKVDVAVVEVGLGGRLDPTNVIEPLACAIARIGLDHTKVLGDTIGQIAMEKAGIIKPGVPVALQAQEEEARARIQAVCAQRGAACLDLTQYPPVGVVMHARGASFHAELPGLSGDFAISLAGEHQVANAMTALALLGLVRERMGLSLQQVQRGLLEARWPGRLEWFPQLLLDGAHNPQGVACLTAYLRRFFSNRRPVLLMGVMANKDSAEMVRLLSPLCARAVCVRPEGIERALDPAQLRDLFLAQGLPAETAASSLEGLQRARQLAGQDGLVLCCGSLYLVGEIRLSLMKEDSAAS